MKMPTIRGKPMICFKEDDDKEPTHLDTLDNYIPKIVSYREWLTEVKKQTFEEAKQLATKII